jgi:hypothetical protein
MRTYVKTTGAVFGLLVLAHLARLYAEGWPVATDPAFVLTTLMAVGLSAWAWRLLQKPANAP